MLDSRFIEFSLDYSKKKNLDSGEYVSSEVISAGGYRWSIRCYPSGKYADDTDDTDDEIGEYLSIYLRLLSKSKDVKAFFDVTLLNTNGKPSSVRKMSLDIYNKHSKEWGMPYFVDRSDLEKLYLKDGSVRFMCGVIVVLEKSTAPMPPSDIGIHLGRILDCAVGTDVSFVVDGETFPAHRAVMAARSPVFKAQLFGSMAEATMPSIEVQAMKPAVFKVMLRFMYTDSFPEDKELGDPPTSMLQHLLTAADRYVLDRLKLICSLKLIENISVDTVNSILLSAETYNCPELKNKCLEFLTVDENFKKAVFMDGFATLLKKFPVLAAELKTRVVK